MSRSATFPRRPFYLVRHGESVANSRSYPAGQLDSRLTKLGRMQAQEAAELMTALSPLPEHLVISPLYRSHETGRIINHALSLPASCDRFIKEQHYGIHQGRNKTQLVKINPEWQTAPQGGETFGQFEGRVARRIGWWLQRDPRLPAFICHGGVFQAMTRYLTGTRVRNIANCAVYFFEPAKTRQGGWAIWRVDEDGFSRV